MDFFTEIERFLLKFYKNEEKLVWFHWLHKKKADKLQKMLKIVLFQAAIMGGANKMKKLFLA